MIKRKYCRWAETRSERVWRQGASSSRGCSKEENLMKNPSQNRSCSANRSNPSYGLMMFSGYQYGSKWSRPMNGLAGHMTNFWVHWSPNFHRYRPYKANLNGDRSQIAPVWTKIITNQVLNGMHIQVSNCSQMLDYLCWGCSNMFFLFELGVSGKHIGWTWFMSISINVTYIHTYIYIGREREREKDIITLCMEFPPLGGMGTYGFPVC